MVAIRELKGLKILIVSNFSLDFHNKLPENPLSLRIKTNETLASKQMESYWSLSKVSNNTVFDGYVFIDSSHTFFACFSFPIFQSISPRCAAISGSF